MFCSWVCRWFVGFHNRRESGIVMVRRGQRRRGLRCVCPHHRGRGARGSQRQGGGSLDGVDGQHTTEGDRNVTPPKKPWPRAVRWGGTLEANHPPPLKNPSGKKTPRRLNPQSDVRAPVSFSWMPPGRLLGSAHRGAQPIENSTFERTGLLFVRLLGKIPLSNWLIFYSSGCCGGIPIQFTPSPLYKTSHIGLSHFRLFQKIFILHKIFATHSPISDPCE